MGIIWPLLAPFSKNFQRFVPRIVSVQPGFAGLRKLYNPSTPGGRGLEPPPWTPTPEGGGSNQPLFQPALFPFHWLDPSSSPGVLKKFPTLLSPMPQGQARPPPPLLAGPRPPSAVPRGQSPWPLPALLLAALGLAAGLAGGAGAARWAGAGAGAGARAWRCAAARGRRDEEFVELDLGEGSAGKAGRRYGGACATAPKLTTSLLLFWEGL